MSRIVIRNGTVLTGGGARRVDVAVEGAHIADVGVVESAAADTEIDATGCWVGPGFVDLHTHLRDPGQTAKEDLATGSRAAAAGGYTAVVAMPNTAPPLDGPALIEDVRRRSDAVGLVDVAAAGCLTEGRHGRVPADIAGLWAVGVRLFTDDGDTVADPELLATVMERIARLGGVVSQHAIDPALAGDGQMHAGVVSQRMGVPGIPSAAEERLVARDLELVKRTGVRYHLQHVSTAGAVDLVRSARAEGLPVTCEVTPHHLAFDHRDVETGGTRFKMMPPLRTEGDRDRLRDALRRGDVDAVATDHAPHTDAEKARPFSEAPNGVTGLEWAAAVVNSVVQLSIGDFFERLSTTPARIAGLDTHGRPVEAGNNANLVVFDPGTETVPTTTASKSSNSPYLGKRWRGVVRATMLRGRVTSGKGAA